MTSLDRRGVLKGLTVAAAGATVTGAVTGSPAAAAPHAAAAGQAAAVPFPQPAMRRTSPSTGRLTTRLTVRFTELKIPGVGKVLTRTYEGSVPGPTLRVRPGDSLEITQVNALPPNTGPHEDDAN